MATALVRLTLMVASRLKNIGSILRASSEFVKASSRVSAKTIFNYKDIGNFVRLNLKDEHKKYIQYIKKKLFNSLEAHEFIFFSEDELREYITKIDPTAEILKLFEFKEVDLYIVRFSDIRTFLNLDDPKNVNVILDFVGVGFLQMFQIYMQYFLTGITLKIQMTLKDLINKLNYIVDSKNNNNDLVDKINRIINTYKQADIDNTYCISCYCCCGCIRGSCCCSCDCDLIHYTQAWEDARNEIIETIKNDLTNIKNKNSFVYYMSNRLYEDNKISLLNEIMILASNFLFNVKHKSKNSLLFAVIKENEFLTKSKKIGILRIVYNVIKKYKGYVIEYEKLISEIQKELENNNIIRNKNQIQQYISKISKRNIKITKIKDHKTNKIMCIVGGKNG